MMEPPSFPKAAEISDDEAVRPRRAPGKRLFCFRFNSPNGTVVVNRAQTLTDEITRITAGTGSRTALETMPANWPPTNPPPALRISTRICTPTFETLENVTRSP